MSCFTTTKSFLVWVQLCPKILPKHKQIYIRVQQTETTAKATSTINELVITISTVVLEMSRLRYLELSIVSCPTLSMMLVNRQQSVGWTLHQWRNWKGLGSFQLYCGSKICIYCALVEKGKPCTHTQQKSCQWLIHWKGNVITLFHTSPVFKQNNETLGVYILGLNSHYLSTLYTCVTECICTLCLCCCMYFGCVALSLFFRVCTSVDLLRMRYVLWFRRHYETSL